MGYLMVLRMVPRTAQRTVQKMGYQSKQLMGLPKALHLDRCFEMVLEMVLYSVGRLYSGKKT